MAALLGHGSRVAALPGCQRRSSMPPPFKLVRKGSRSAPCKKSEQLLCPPQALATSGMPVDKGDLLNRTYYPTSADAANLTKKWFVIDAEGQVLGRLATLAAEYIRGKNSRYYTPSMDMGAFVIVTNAEKVTVTGKKKFQKTYYRHVNGRPGSETIESYRDLQKRLPQRIIERAVQGMLPKGRLGQDIKLHLKVYKGAAHPHAAQQPKDVTKEISVKPRNLDLS